MAKEITLPSQLKALESRKIWLCWNYEQTPKDEKPRKVPKNAVKGCNASTMDCNSWVTFPEAIKGMNKYNFSGLGVCFTDNELWGFDIDHCRNKETGEIIPEAWTVIKALNSYTEVSPSGTGVHILCVGAIPQGRRKVITPYKNHDGAAVEFEMYETGRYFTFTGDIVNLSELKDRTKEAIEVHKKYFPQERKNKTPVKNNSPILSMDITERDLLDIMFKSENGEILKALWNGNYQVYSNDRSRADLRFLNALAFYTGKDAHKMDSLFRQSGMMRRKWDELRGGKTYGEICISKAIDSCESVFGEKIVRTERSYREKASTVVCDETKHLSLIETLEKLQAFSKYETNDKGFGNLFADVFKGKHRYNTDRKTFMFYDGKKWVNDYESMCAKNSAKELSDALMIYAINCPMMEKEKMEYKKQILALSSMRKRHTMIDDSKDIYYFQNADLDQDDYILNVSNGTLDLTDLEPKFVEHNADMLLSKMCNVEYNPSATCKTWLKFLDDVMQGDKAKICFLQKIAGLSLTGNTQEETMFILYGSTTRNGKSTFVETLIYLLGDYALTMQPESLAIKHNTDSRQANGDIARLDGCRLCNASEPPKRMLFNTALLKSLLGRDSITARHLHEREFSFIPKFKLLMNTNYLPTITDDTVFSSNRINVISFDRHFEPHEQDKTLKQKLRSAAELSGILNWCIEGLRLYRIEGLKPPAAVQNATNIYRTDSDKVGNFLDECMVKSDKNTKAKDVYDEYEKWCNENGYGVENKGNFFAELKSKNILKPSGTVKGKTEKNIVKGYVLAEHEFTSLESNSEIPFS